MMTRRKNKFSRQFKVSAAGIILLMAAAILFVSRHTTLSRSYISDLENPFFDVFTLYFYDEKEEAKKRLLQLMENEKFRTHAYINYGILLEREENDTEAEQYYRKALKEGDTSALLYLFSLINSTAPIKILPLLDSCGDIDSTAAYWVEYERAAYYMNGHNTDKALAHLEKAVRSGFYSALLVNADPAFNPVRDNPRFKAIISGIGNNRSNFLSLKQALEKAEEKFFEKLPHGLARELKQYLELDNRRFPAVEGQLSALLGTNLEFRDRCVVLYWLAGLRAKKGDFNSARMYLTQFTALINSGTPDRSGFKKVVQAYQKDILYNDPVMKRLSN